VLERPLPEDELRGLVDRARAISGDPTAIRAVRQVVVVAGRW
jgi:hypothetical protein